MGVSVHVSVQGVGEGGTLTEKRIGNNKKERK